MKEPKILHVNKDVSNPWFVQIEKAIKFPGQSKNEIYYSIRPPDYVTALTRTEEGKFIVLRQYRPAVEDYTYELPSGHIDHGETPAQAMTRELKEETGCEVGDLTLLGRLIPDTGRLENRLWAFYADKIKINYIPEPEENEGIEIHLVSNQELIGMINEGLLNHALDLSVIALAIFHNYLKL
jgi:8-oxo-dGTP pyrophosphatase MutT (NUDIX family)